MSSRALLLSSVAGAYVFWVVKLRASVISGSYLKRKGYGGIANVALICMFYDESIMTYFPSAAL